MEDLSDRLVFKPLRLPLERFAFEIADGLPDLCDDRVIRSSMKAQRLDVRTDNVPWRVQYSRTHSRPSAKRGLKLLGFGAGHLPVLVAPSGWPGKHAT